MNSTKHPHHKPLGALCIPLIIALCLISLFSLLACEKAIESKEISSSILSSSVSQIEQPVVQSQDTLWECSAKDSSISYTASDTLLPTLSIMVMGTNSPEPIQFKAFMRFSKNGTIYKVCPTSDYANISRSVRGDFILQAGVKLTSDYGELLAFTVNKIMGILFDSDDHESQSEYIYRP